jgi:hypothetical protein
VTYLRVLDHIRPALRVRSHLIVVSQARSR